jgi:monodehydroascorbate reductase (NADH)
MAAQVFKYVVLGAGNAAGYAAREFVANGIAPGDLALIGDEDTLPYERPALSKAVLTNEAVRLPGFHTCVGGGGERQNEDWYDRHGIRVLRGKRVVKVDAQSKTCHLRGGEQVVAEKGLILATGADAIRLDALPGASLDGVVYLRNNADAVDLAARLKACAGKKVLVVGGGYIGCEVALAAVTVGCNVSMVFPEAWVMPRLFTEELGRHYEAAFEAVGITLLKDGRVCKQFLGDDAGKVRAVSVCKRDREDAEVEAELVIVGVGARPATGLFKGVVDVSDSGGVVVDGQMQTSVDGVYAVGDIASFPLKMYGGRMARVEHVGHARSSAAHAVRAVCGAQGAAYDYLPFFYSRAGSISWKFFGDNVGECVVLGDLATKLAAFWIRDGKVVGVFCEKPSDEESQVMQEIAVQRPAADSPTVKGAGNAEAALAMLSSSSA